MSNRGYTQDIVGTAVYVMRGVEEASQFTHHHEINIIEEEVKMRYPISSSAKAGLIQQNQHPVYKHEVASKCSS